MKEKEKKEKVQAFKVGKHSKWMKEWKSRVQSPRISLKKWLYFSHSHKCPKRLKPNISLLCNT
jgi:hypothetical protein